MCSYLLIAMCVCVCTEGDEEDNPVQRITSRDDILLPTSELVSAL